GGFQSACGDVGHLVGLAPLEALEEPAVEVLGDVTDPRVADPVREAAGADDGPSLQARLGPAGVAQRLPELVGPPDRYQRWHRTVLHDRDEGDLHAVIELVVDRHD